MSRRNNHDRGRNNPRGGPPGDQAGHGPGESPNEPHGMIDPDRLIEASLAALRAIVEVTESETGPWPYPADLMGAPEQPKCLCDFTRSEIEEASAFLVRMGIIEAPKSPRGG